MSFKPHSALLMAIVIFITVTPVAAFQDSPKKEEEAKGREERRKKALSLVDEILKDAQMLRLPENRLRLLVQTANAVWSVDEKRARLLFKSAQESLKELQAVLDGNDPQYADLGQLTANIRAEMLNTLAQHDPEMALDLLRATRQTRDGQSPAAQAAFEAQMEMQLAQHLAAKDPAKAIELAEHGLARGVSYDVVNLVNTLSMTNREAAQKLFDEMLTRLQSENYATNPSAAYVALNLLQQWLQRRDPSGEPGEREAGGITSLNFSAQAARDLCNKLLRVIADASAGAGEAVPLGNVYGLLRQLQPMLPGIEKLVPSQASMLEARMAEMQRFTERQNGPWGKVQELVNTGTVSELLTAAGNWPPDMQNHLLQSAAWKAFNDGNTDLARQIIEEKITDPRVRQEMQANIDRQVSERMINEGKIAEARAFLTRLPSVADRISFLTRLAAMAAEKGDKDEARQLLNEAQAQVSNRAENYQTLYAQLTIANAYYALDPPRGYEIVESAIERLNELTVAAATLNGFDVQQYFRSDEFILSNGNPLSQLLQQIGSQLGAIAEKDVDRARALADRVARPEMKTWLFVTMLPAALNDSGEAKVESIRLIQQRHYPMAPMMVRNSGVIIDER